MSMLTLQDALDITESYGPMGADINEDFQIKCLLRDEVKRLKTDAEYAWKNTHILEQERQKLETQYRANDDRWDTIETLWTCGSVELSTDDNGLFTVNFEGAEHADAVWRGIDPDSAIDAATAAIKEAT